MVVADSGAYHNEESRQPEPGHAATGEEAERAVADAADLQDG